MPLLWRMTSLSLYVDNEGMPYWHENCKDYLFTWSSCEEEEIREYAAGQTDGEYQVKLEKLAEIPEEDLEDLAAVVAKNIQIAKGVAP